MSSRQCEVCGMLLPLQTGRGAPDADRAALLRSVGAKLLVLGDATVVLPGHGTSTTIGGERRFNPYCKDLSRD